MSTQNIIDKIISDAVEEAERIVRTADEKAQAILDKATLKAEQIRKEAEEEVRVKTQSIQANQEASDRLEGAKIHLAEKRKVLDCVYKMALGELVSLGKEDAVKLANTLLEKYAEEGDTLSFAENYKYADAVKLLPIIQARKISVSDTRITLDGGMRLTGKTADKDLSYGAILSADKERYQAELAKKLFQK